MSRFQAQTNGVLDAELEELRDRLGLRENQKADLLREITSLASWVIQQAEAGRKIEARRGRDVVPLVSPVVDRLRERRDEGVVGRLELSDEEIAGLAELLDRGFAPTPALRDALGRLASRTRRPPRLRWKRAAR